jgi:hypothetical protein
MTDVTTAADAIEPAEAQMDADSCARLAALGPLASDAPGQLNVLGHDGDTLGVDGSQVSVLKETHKVGLSSLLQGEDGR